MGLIWSGPVRDALMPGMGRPLCSRLLFCLASFVRLHGTSREEGLDFHRRLATSHGDEHG